MPYLAHTNPDHDESLVARLAADDLPAGGPDDRLARSQVADCPACAELLADLKLIVGATSELPVPRRTRDFRLTEADAARLRPHGWRGALARLGSPGFAFTRPLAAGLATLGIAGLLLASLPAGFMGSAASAPERVLSVVGNSVGSGSGYGAAAAPSPLPDVHDVAASPAASAAPVAAGPSAAASAPAASPEPIPAATQGSDGNLPSSAPGSPGGVVGVTAGGSSKGGTPGQGVASPPTIGSPATDNQAPANTGGPSPLVLLSVVLLASGLVLGALRLAARRLV